MGITTWRALLSALIFFIIPRHYRNKTKKINQQQPSPNFYISLIFLQWLSLLGALILAMPALALLMLNLSTPNKPKL